MTSITTRPPLGSKENPHPYKFGQKYRTKGHYYLSKKAELRYYNGNKLINRDKKKQYNSNEKMKKYQANYRKKNSEKNILYQKKYYINNKEKSRTSVINWRKNNPEKQFKQQQKYYKNNKKKICAQRKLRRKNDPIYKLTIRTRNRVRDALKRQNAYKNKRTMEYVNCSVAHLYYHIEQQFTEGMNWKNHGYGRGKWNIDHRRPCDSFDLNDEEQTYMCFHWTNLQPMWHYENCYEKGNKFDPKTFRYKWIDREIGWVGIPSYLMNK